MRSFDINSKLVVAHRGDNHFYPENTMLSFRKAIENGAKGIETDIAKTIDGQYVMLHDYTVDRTTNGTGNVSELTYDYIRSLDAGSWKGSEFSNREDTKVPNVQEVVDLVIEKDVFLILHMKTGSFTNEQDFIDVVQYFVSRDLLDYVVFFVEGKGSLLRSVLQDGYSVGFGASTNESNFEERFADVMENHSLNGLGPSASSEHIEIGRQNGKPAFISYVTSNFYNTTVSLIEKNASFILTDDVSSSVRAFSDKKITQISPNNLTPEPEPEFTGRGNFDAVFIKDGNKHHKVNVVVDGVKIDGVYYK